VFCNQFGFTEKSLNVIIEFMENLIVSFDSNVLKVSYTDKKAIYSTELNLDPSLVDNSHILNEQGFAQALLQAISTLGAKPKSPVLNFLISPENVYTFFMTVSKNMPDIDGAILTEARKKLENVSIDELYYSYQKIAPFVYQFTAVKKQILEDYLELSNIVNIPVQSVIPWLFLFPKILADNDPCIFITKANNKEVVALSEFNGIYYTGLYDDKNTTSEDIEKLVAELSIYKRVNPIRRVFLVDAPHFNPGPNFVVSELPIPINALTDSDNNKLHILFNYLIERDNSFLFNNTNLLNLIAVPAVEHANRKVMVVAGLGALLLVLGGLGFFGMSRINNDSGQVASETTQSQVLSEKDEAKQSTQTQEEEKKEQEEKKAEDLKKEDLKVRVENGAGIPGIAAKTQSTLEGLGYVVTSIGNSEGDNRENTLLKFKNSKSAYKVLLSEDLKKEYELVVEDDLDESLEYDVLVVLGKN
jgi:hypothetical protein